MRNLQFAALFGTLIALPTASNSGWCIVCIPPPQCDPAGISPIYKQCGSYEYADSCSMFYKRNYGCNTPPGDPAQTSWYIDHVVNIPTWTCTYGWCYL